ncbi:MAG: VWA domain-containing protein [Anaerolineae bacterium]|nr:VWA domain-containing protein [Anaerolineae bacterium]
MSFFTPLAFALALLLPLIVLMYLLKLRRRERVVSSVYLWRRMVRDVEANAPWQKLRRNLLLLVQLLFVAALILTLARPFTWAEGGGGESAILIVDRSASMAAHDVAPTRLEAAKARARQFVDALPDDVRVTVIAAGDGAQVLTASSQDRRQVRAALDAIQGRMDGDLTAALELAAAIAARQPDTEIVLFSDGQVTVPERLAIQGTVRYLQMGIDGENQGISALSLRAADAGGATPANAFVQVTNYGDAPAQRRLALYADGQAIHVYDVTIEPGESHAIVAGDIPAMASIVEARLLEAPSAGQDGGPGDYLALDDQAWAVHRRQAPAEVTLVSAGNLFLETALSLFPNLQLSVVRPEDFDAPPEPDGPSDGNDPTTAPTGRGASPGLTIFDATVPITAALPPGNLLFIAPPRSTAYFSVTGQIDQPVPRAVNAADPLLTNVIWGGVGVLEAMRLPLPTWARAVVAGDAPGSAAPTGISSAGSAPLLFAGETDGRRIAVLAFALHRSDLPLQVAFPLLVANLTGWLAPGVGGGVPAQVTPGEPLSLSLPPEVAAVQVTRPDGSMARLETEGGQAVFADTSQLGVYRVDWESGTADPGGSGGLSEAYFAVNLFSPQESRIRPASSLPLTGISPQGQGTGQAGSVEAGKEAHRARREWWRPLAFAALALLVLEWLVYQRATLARLFSRLKPVKQDGKRET